ncbi:MAG TPA: HAD family phosphatase [Candidatus Acidoferrales bacterium]|nr:HAD family phosphatase [Candidatus Acidoferrales bacterium]
MSGIAALFWDVGGVILTNGWDTPSRKAAVEKFRLDWNDFEKRHAPANEAFETGKASLDEYLARTIFYQPRAFSAEDFKNFMFSESRKLPESYEFVKQMAAAGRYPMAAINNEGAEINAYRIAQFDLRGLFRLFFSSCYMHVRKPDPAIFRMTLGVTQHEPEDCIFVDDREENLEGARKAGLRTARFENVAQLKVELQKLGVEIPTA